MTSDREFQVDINKFIEKAENNINTFMLEFTQDLAEAVVTGTPVDTGFLRASWTVNLNAPDLQTVGTYKGQRGLGKENAQPAQTAAMTQITANLIGVKGGDIVYYTNNAGYGHFVEFGTSRMAGRGFVRNAVNKAPSLAKKALAKVRK